MQLDVFKEQYFESFETCLLKTVEPVTEKRVKDAMLYSLMNGGKRVRPLLLLASLKALNSPVEDGFFIACALEYIHTYSLIHDDLPAMDNDDYRRGQLTNHKKFDEATAILAGDALQTMAFELLANAPVSNDKKVILMSELARSAGPNGMIGGQMADILAENKQISLDELMHIHQRKTGDLLRFAVTAATIVSECSSEGANYLVKFAESFGLAFQIHNDLQDVAQDEKLQKSTYVSLLGFEKAKEMLEMEINRALAYITKAKAFHQDLDDLLLQDFLKYVQYRG